MKLFELKQKTPVLYVDMDGVLADFYGPFNKMAGVSNWSEADKSTVSQVLQQITTMKDFWSNLDVLSDVPTIMQGIKEATGGDYVILSKALAGDPNVVSQKKQWISKLPLKPKQVIILPATADKGKYALQPDGTKNILIDDFGYNIKKWQEAGGIAIKHKNGRAKNTLEILKQAISRQEI